MYRVITYKSKELKKKTIVIAAEPSAADFDVPESTPKKERKKNKEQIKEHTYMIDGVEVSEEDLTDDERADLESNAILNLDGFYNALQPIDYVNTEPEKGETSVNKGNKKYAMMALVIVGAIAIIAGICFAVMKFM